MSDAEDAARYRYLRDHCSYSYAASLSQPAEAGLYWERWDPYVSRVSLDAAIDEDMAAQSGGVVLAPRRCASARVLKKAAIRIPEAFFCGPPGATRFVSAGVQTEAA